MSGNVIYMTSEGLKKLEDELEYLVTVKRKEIARYLHEAIDEGDEVDDNVAYEVAKNAQAFLEGRIREIEEKLARARLVESNTPSDVAQIGSTVVLKDEQGNKETYKIVGPTETNPREGLISYESPLGQALLNRKAREDIFVNAPGGKIFYRLLNVG
jgi:transcription elongation factor GreA